MNLFSAERLDVGYVREADNHKLHLYCNILHTTKNITFCRFQKTTEVSGFNVLDGLSDGRYRLVVMSFCFNFSWIYQFCSGVAIVPKGPIARSRCRKVALKHCVDLFNGKLLLTKYYKLSYTAQSYC